MISRREGDARGEAVSSAAGGSAGLDLNLSLGPLPPFARGSFSAGVRALLPGAQGGGGRSWGWRSWCESPSSARGELVGEARVGGRETGCTLTPGVARADSAPQTQTSTRAHTHKHAHTHMHTRGIHTHTYIRVYTQVHKHTCTHTNMHTHAHAHTQAHIYTRAHAGTQAHLYTH